MAQTALTAVTEVDTTLTALAAYIAAHPTAGVGVYSESGFATPTNANEVAASTFDTNAAMISHYAGLAAVQTDSQVVAATDATRHVFATTPNRKAIVKGGATVYTNTDAARNHIAGHLADGAVIYVQAAGYKTNYGWFYKLLDGTFANDYISGDKIEFALHDTSS